MKRIKTYKEICESNKVITELDYSYNYLTELPELPSGLEYLNCSGNKLPYDDLVGYWDWYYNVKYPKKGLTRKYNI